MPGVLDALNAGVPYLDVLVVDDGSSDSTFEVARSAGVAVARLPFNLGVGSALRAGFRYAVEHGYERALQCDADGQHEPGEIEKLLEALDEGWDLVVGSRFASASTPYQVGPIRGGAMAVLRLVTYLLSAQRFTDPTSGFRAFSAPLMAHFAGTYPLDYLSDTVEALLLAIYDGYEVGEVPVSMSYRTEGEPSNRNFKLAFHFVRLLMVIALTASTRARRELRRTKKLEA